MENAASPTAFETEIVRFNQWREELAQAVNAYHDWLEANGALDVQQSIRFYDLLENLNKGRLMLAFLAEFSRGKSELINALFFSRFKERLLPSDVGRTTMCPTEIFHDPNEEPYLRLLSVETRYRDESISQLKNMPVEWSKLRLNVGSAKEMKDALRALADTKKVYALEARMLGLAPMLDEAGRSPGEEELVDVPAWRYAMINYPHPLLSSGLSILDTPGLNALGMEPELTVSTLPGAHAILFLLSIDTGVTRSDLDIWERYVRPGLPQKIAVLNKIDLMWDELKTGAEVDQAIARMIDTTAQTLQLPRNRIFALSAQKALLAKVRDDAELLAKSGIGELERFLAEQIIPLKRQILCKAVVNEIGGMMASSRASIAKKQEANRAEVAEMQALSGKSRDVVTKIWARITAEKNAYNATLAEYKVNHVQLASRRAALSEMLNPEKLEAMLAESARSMEESWTTITLQRAMRSLSMAMSEDFQAVFVASENLKIMMQGVYDTFIEKFAFQPMQLPALDLDPHRTKLKLLVHETEAFARDPVNVAHYKGPLVRKFYGTLVKQARGIFTDARNQTERWMQAVTLPLEVQIKDHKAQLQSRLDNLARINEKAASIGEQMAILKSAEAELAQQRAMIDALVARVARQEAKTSMLAELPPPPAHPPLEAPIQFMKPKAAPAGATPETDAKPAAAKPVPVPPAGAPAAEQPLVSDDLMAELARIPSPNRDDPTTTQPAPRRDDPTTTQPLSPRPERAQPVAEPSAVAPANESRPAAPPGAQPLDDSIWRLQEAKRILQGIRKG